MHKEFENRSDLYLAFMRQPGNPLVQQFADHALIAELLQPLKQQAYLVIMNRILRIG
ncbi:hypothetical protein D3C87_2194850 [compost metagenome]